MHKTIKELNLQVDILREDKTYIAYSPALDLATHGRSVAEARKSFIEAAELFFETIIEKGNLRETLINLGWRVRRKEWLPPMIISRSTQSVNVPIS